VRRLGVRVEVLAEWDYPVYEAVVRAARRVDADLIVAERHAGRYTGAALLHLNDWELLRRAPVPVLLVKRRGLYRRPRVLAAVDPDRRYAKPAQLDRDELAAGVGIAEALRGSPHVVHAFSPVPLSAYTQGILSEDILADMQRHSARTAAAKLERLAGRAGIPAVRRHLIARHPSDAIEQAAAETGSAIVVMGALALLGVETPADRQHCRTGVGSPDLRPAGRQANGFGGAVPRSPRGARYLSVRSGSVFS
jgi:universal stress protein E